MTTTKEYVLKIESLRRDIIEHIEKASNKNRLQINGSTSTNIFICFVDKGLVYYKEVNGYMLSSSVYDTELDTCSMDELYIILTTMDIQERREERRSNNVFNNR